MKKIQYNEVAQIATHSTPNGGNDKKEKQMECSWLKHFSFLIVAVAAIGY